MGDQGRVGGPTGLRAAVLEVGDGLYEAAGSALRLRVGCADPAVAAGLDRAIAGLMDAMDTAAGARRALERLERSAEQEPAPRTRPARPVGRGLGSRTTADRHGRAGRAALTPRPER